MQIIPASNIACPWRVKTVELCTGWFGKGMSLLADLLEPRLAQSHSTVVISAKLVIRTEQFGSASRPFQAYALFNEKLNRGSKADEERGLRARLASAKLALFSRSSTASWTRDSEYLFWAEFCFHGAER